MHGSIAWLDMKGRADRREFVAVVVPSLVLMIVYLYGFSIFAPPPVPLGPALVEMAGVLLLIGVIFVAATRRLHDLGQSALWLYGLGIAARVVMLIGGWLPLGLSRNALGLSAFGLGLAALAILKGNSGDNRFGPFPGA